MPPQRRAEADQVEQDFNSLVANDRVMRRYAAAVARRISDCRPVVMGFYAEAVVAEELDATLAIGGMDDHDVIWSTTLFPRPVSIQVKTCSLPESRSVSGISFRIAPPRGARRAEVDPTSVSRRAGDVWVFAVHHGRDHRDGWSFLVQPASHLDGSYGGRKQVALSRLPALDAWITRQQLRSQVEAVLPELIP